MECTQRLESESSQVERIPPEQVGFLGILGTKYPIFLGPNKIGRDPECPIVLNKNSISRHHAVINVLSRNKYMLMDLNSANKTRLNDKSLQAYIPVPLSNGDLVQFGEEFGIFQLLEQESDLPCTQAIDIPDTPVANTHASRVKQATIPESPDVSDKDDSFIMPSQTKSACHFKSPRNFVKSVSRTITVHPIGSNKIDNIFWSSSKKSNSFNLDDSTSSRESGQNRDIQETNTKDQTNESADSIYTAETQLPVANASPSIHSLNTQMPDHVTAVYKINKLQEMDELELNLSTANKENDNNIFDAETQCVISAKTSTPSLFEANTQLPDEVLDSPTSDNIFEANTQLPSHNYNNSGNLFDANTEMPFDQTSIKDNKLSSEPSPELKSEKSMKSLNIAKDEAETQDILDDFQSQDIQTSKSENQPIFQSEDNEEIPLSQSDTITDEVILLDQNENSEILSQIKPTKRNIRIESEEACENVEELSQVKPTMIIESDESNGCNDVTTSPNEQIPARTSKDQDLTDCEEGTSMFESKNAKPVPCSPEINFENMATQVIPEIDQGKVSENVEAGVDGKTENAPCFEDMLTQVIPEKPSADLDIETMPTQVIPQEISSKLYDTDASQYSEEIISPFKVPLRTTVIAKRKDANKSSETRSSKINVVTVKTETIINEDDENYYEATQDILEDLSSQKDPIDVNNENNNNKYKSIPIADDEVVPCSVEDYQAGEKFQHLENEVRSTLLEREESTESSDGEEKVNKFVTSLSANQLSDVIGVDISRPKKEPSDSSNVEMTPEKLRPFKVKQIEYPDSQEIKTCRSLKSISITIKSSSESEVEKESQEESPIVFRKKKRVKRRDVKKDLSTEFDVQALPTRISQRNKRPTSKILESNLSTRTQKYLTEQDDNVNTDIISANIVRLKRKNEQKNTTKTEEGPKKDLTNIETVAAEVKPTSKRRNNKTINKNNETDLNHVNNKLTDETSKLEDKSVEPIASSVDKLKEDTKSSTKRNTKEKKSEKFVPKSKTEQKSKVDESLNSTAETNLSTRSTRNRTKINYDENKSVTPDKSPVRKRGRPKKDKSGRPKKDNTIQKEDDSFDDDSKRSKKEEAKKKPEDQQLRRSRREKTKAPEKSNSQYRSSGTPEQSTVYNISSETSGDSPKGSKRAAPSDLDVPCSKRTRSAVSVTSAVSSGVTSTKSSLRSTPTRFVKAQRVLFTAFASAEVNEELEKRGATIVSDVLTCTVVLTMSLKRTFKLLCAVGLGRPIVGPQWVQACVDAGTIVDPWQYLLKDEANENRFKFSLARTLAGPRQYLKGYNVSATPKVLPTAPEMKLIVECSGGVWKEGGSKWIAVTCLADKPLWPALRRKGATVVTVEFILTGVLRQELDINAYLIKDN